MAWTETTRREYERRGRRASAQSDPARRGFANLQVPDNITLLPLPPRSPELNPVENIWQFIRDNWLSNRVFKSYEDILNHCCYAWNQLTQQPWKIIPVGVRDWAYL